MSRCVSGAGGGLLLRVLVLLLSVQAVFSACAHVIYAGQSSGERERDRERERERQGERERDRERQRETEREREID